MKNLKEIDHVGFAVRDIMTTSQHYIDAGWTMSQIFVETVQNTQIAFLTYPGMVTIELVSPLTGASPIDNILKKTGVTPYHICYVVDDIMQSVEDLYEEGFKLLFMPIESCAMNNRLICYLYHLDVGAIELVQRN